MKKHSSSANIWACAIAIIVLLWLLNMAATPVQAEEMEQIGPSIWRGEYSYNDILNNPIKLIAIKIDPMKYFISVTDVVHEITKSGQIPYPRYSILELVKVTKLFLILNGGFHSSYSLPRPTNLFINHGKIIQIDNENTTTQNGLFYIDKKTAKPHIVPFKTAGTLSNGKQRNHPKKQKNVYKNYYMALQSGPLLIYKSERVYNKIKNKFFRRSVVALSYDGNHELRMLFIITLHDTSLYGLAGFLSTSENKGGLGCIAALNLGGGRSSGLILSEKNNPSLKIEGKTYQVGNSDAANATVIAVSVK